MEDSLAWLRSNQPDVDDLDDETLLSIAKSGWYLYAKRDFAPRSEEQING